MTPIPLDNIASLQEKINKYAKRAVKLGVTPITLNVSDEVISVKVPYGTDERGATLYTEVPGKEVEIIGELPKLNGWRLIASIQLIDGHTIIRCVPGQTLPQRFREATDYCEHCNSRGRGRKDVFVLLHEDGTYRQVGRSCIGDFLGHGDPQRFIWYAEILDELSHSIRDYESSGGTQHYWLSKVLPIAAATIRMDGWVSRTRAKELSEYSRIVSTAERVWTLISPPPPKQDDEDRKWRADRKPTDEDTKIANEALEWAKALTDLSNDYLYNINVIASMGYIDYRSMGIAVSIVSSYQRHVGILKEREKQKASEHFGTIKKREVFELTVQKVIPIDTMYGLSFLHIFKDQHGNVATWKASKEKLEENVTYKGKATVVEHSEYKGVKQTVLSRCALEKL